MKTLIKNTLLTTFSIIAVMITIPATADSNDSVKFDNDEKALGLTAQEIEEIMTILDSDLEEITDDTVTYEFFGANDELIFSKTVSGDEIINDEQFIMLKAKSDFLMKTGNTLIYRQ